MQYINNAHIYKNLTNQHSPPPALPQAFPSASPSYLSRCRDTAAASAVPAAPCPAVPSPHARWQPGQRLERYSSCINCPIFTLSSCPVPARTMATRLSALFDARLVNARTASKFSFAFPSRTSCTSGSTAPARTMATLLSAPLMPTVKLLSACAARPFSFTFSVLNSCTSGSTAPARTTMISSTLMARLANARAA
eukprot:1188366-Prorocentrum_minimum.AAC.2